VELNGWVDSSLAPNLREHLSMFDTGLLRTFVAVADCGGFTNAPKLLNSTQSTVSAQIQRLEEEAGCVLFG